MLDSILITSESGISIPDFFICTLVSLILGLGLTYIHMYRNRYTKNFLVTLILLPVIVQIIIMMVNGNLGTGVAVMGAFSLVRFRSMPGNSREITSIFLAMAIGLATGMGYLGIAIVFVILVGTVENNLHFPSVWKRKRNKKRIENYNPRRFRLYRYF